MAGILVVFGDRTANEFVEAASAAMAAGQIPPVKIEQLYFDAQKFTTEDCPRLSASGAKIRYIVGIADEVWKRRVVEACENAGWEAQAVVHPSAVVAPSAKLASGVFVGPLAVVSSNGEVGAHAIIHLHASVGHDCLVGEHSSILPGARLSGNVWVGARVVVGSNAFVGAGIKVGDDCRIDALSYVTQDVPDGFLVSPRLPRPVKRVC
jgi:sugar O-acyltransferase (sialic acid O-acetyltransferase NeuD family)